MQKYKLFLLVIFIALSQVSNAENSIVFLGTIDRITYARDVELPGGEENLLNMIRCGEEIVTFQVNSVLFGNIKGKSIEVKSFLSEFCHSTTNFNLQEEAFLVLAYETNEGYFVGSSAPATELITKTTDEYAVKAYSEGGDIFEIFEKLKIKKQIKENLVCDSADLIEDAKAEKKKQPDEAEILKFKKVCSGVLINEIKLKGKL